MKRHRSNLVKGCCKGSMFSVGDQTVNVGTRYTHQCIEGSVHEVTHKTKERRVKKKSCHNYYGY